MRFSPRKKVYEDGIWILYGRYESVEGSKGAHMSEKPICTQCIMNNENETFDMSIWG